MVQLGSFNCGGQHYSLMTMDAMRAVHFDDSSLVSAADGDAAFPRMPANASMMYIGDSMHVVEPVNDNDTAMLGDDAGTIYVHVLHLVSYFMRCVFFIYNHFC